MTSTKRPSSVAEKSAWRAAGLLFYTHKFHLHKEFGYDVRKVSVDAGLTCPNVDGRIGVGGCVFCNDRSFSPSRRLASGQTIRAQIEHGIDCLRTRFRATHYLAYFQPASNTYAPVTHLRRLLHEALAHPQVVGLAIGTRPDCVPPPVLDLLEGLSRDTYVSVEYGMQTTDDRLLDWMHRGHHYDAFLDAVERSRGRGFRIGAHVILGLPGQGRDQVVATAREIARLDLDSVKIHNLYAVRNTPLADQVRSGKVRLLERQEFVNLAVDFIEYLPPHCVVERLGGSAPAQFLVAPSWCGSRQSIRVAVERELRSRATWQGRFHGRAGPGEAVFAPDTRPPSVRLDVGQTTDPATPTD